MKLIQKLILSAMFVFVSNCLSASTAWANSEQAAIVIISTGDFYAVAKDDKKQNKRPLTRRSKIFVGDTLVTGKNSRGQVRFIDGAIVSLRPESSLLINEYNYGKKKADEKASMTLIKGGFRTITGAVGKEKYKVTSSMASIGIRGTHYEAVIHDDQMYVALWDGGVTVSNDAGSVDLGLGADYNFAHVQSTTTEPTGLLDAPEVITSESQPAIAPDLSSAGDNSSASPESAVETDLTQLALQSDEMLAILPTEIMPDSGGAVYTATDLSFSGTSSSGDISNFNFNATVNFASADITGSLSFQDGASSTWNVEFAGNYTGNTLNVNIDELNSTIDGSNQIGGTIDGQFLGKNADTIKGSFDLHDTTDTTVTASGTFEANK